MIFKLLSNIFMFAGLSIKSSPFITNLGVIFDHSLYMKKFISPKIRSINH